MLRQITPKYIDTGKAKVVYRHFVFIGDESLWAAQASECANDQGKFWEYATAVFDNQRGENRGAFSKDNLKRFAADLKLDTATFNACLDSNKHVDAIKKETQEGQARGVRATPSFFINGQFVEGLMSAEQMGQAIESLQPKQ